MLKRTKSSNKAAIVDAKNSRDTEATLAGRRQCDEDDYGYESMAANSMYERLLQKYEKNPVDPMAKFPKSRPKEAKDVLATLNKVKDSLAKGDESFQPYRRPQSSTTSDHKSTSSSNSDSATTSKQKVVKNNNAPAPPSFSELLKMAEKKKLEPVSKKELNKNAKPVRESEFHRPMTAKEKEEFIRERNSQLRKQGKLPPATSSDSSDKKSSVSDKNSNAAKSAKESDSSDNPTPSTSSYKPFSRVPANSKIAELARQGHGFPRQGGHPGVQAARATHSAGLL